MATTDLTAAARWSVADQMARQHAAECTICTPPDVTRPTCHRTDPASGRTVETCAAGRQLADSAVGAWRRSIDAMSRGR